MLIEQVITHNAQRQQSRLLQLTVGTGLNPGITRQHRPNEDSLFAIQGTQTYEARLQPFGVFVITAALVAGATTYVVHVGDSRAYLYREPGGLGQITRDHSVVARLVEAGIITPADIYTHPKRNQLVRCLGEKATVEVDAFTLPLEAGDKLLLCSDGLWEMVYDTAIERIMSDHTCDPSLVVKSLIKAALDGGGKDNISVVVVCTTS